MMVTNAVAERRPVQYRDFGRYMQRRRRELGLSQADLAERVRVSQTFVARVEAGTHRPAPEEYSRWADALGLPQQEVLREAGILRQTDAMPLSDPDDELERFWQSASRELKRRLRGISVWLVNGQFEETPDPSRESQQVTQQDADEEDDDETR